ESARPVSARPQEPSSLDEYPALGPTEILGHGQQTLARSEVAAQPFNSRQLSEKGSSARWGLFSFERSLKSSLTQIEVVEIPYITPAVGRRAWHRVPPCE